MSNEVGSIWVVQGDDFTLMNREHTDRTEAYGDAMFRVMRTMIERHVWIFGPAAEPVVRMTLHTDRKTVTITTPKLKDIDVDHPYLRAS